MSDLKILICDDHAIFREGLRRVLDELDAELVEAESGEQALREVDTDSGIGLVLMDLAMPGMDGWTGLRRMRSEHASVPVVIVSASESAADVKQALDAGASGFIPKSSPPAVLRAALGLVLEGGVYIPPALLAGLDALGAPEPAATDGAAERRRQRAGELTPRQLEVLNLLSRGLTNKEIADVLGISPATVKTHVATLLEVLDVTNRTEATLVMRELDLDAEDGGDVG